MGRPLARSGGIAYRPVLVAHMQPRAFAIHLVAKEGRQAFHLFRDNLINAFPAAPMLAGYLRARSGASTSMRLGEFDVEREGVH
jgi:hypothetical protein